MGKSISLWRRGAFLVLAGLIVLSLPFTAGAAEAPGPGQDGGTARQVYSAGQDTFLEEVFSRTHAGLPREGTTRAQYVQILYEAAGRPKVQQEYTFADVPADAGYADAVAWARHEGIVSGEEEYFRPDELITDSQALTLLSAALACLGDAAQDIAIGMLANYTGFKKETDYALTPEQAAAVVEKSMAERGEEGLLPLCSPQRLK